MLMRCLRRRFVDDVELSRKQDLTVVRVDGCLRHRCLSVDRIDCFVHLGIWTPCLPSVRGARCWMVATRCRSPVARQAVDPSGQSSAGRRRCAPWHAPSRLGPARRRRPGLSTHLLDAREPRSVQRQPRPVSDGTGRSMGQREQERVRVRVQKHRVADAMRSYLVLKKAGSPNPVASVHSPSAPAGTATHTFPLATPPLYRSPTSLNELGMTPQLSS
jgi:hypothetical protein